MFIIVCQVLQVWLGNGEDGQCVFERRQFGKCLHFVHEVYDVSMRLISNKKRFMTLIAVEFPRSGLRWLWYL
jgi:hypothetical protein